MIQLFLLKPDFPDEKLSLPGQTYYCPACAWIEGILHYYPFLRDRMEVIHVDFPRPRGRWRRYWGRCTRTARRWCSVRKTIPGR
ncbi:DUF3088 family protein [Chitinophaga pollutisoli]|uniref:DUF3088 family protein n=1 Tax=Chitinophaga pollutisoli TaxID=3133966 RepID=A0ABZ2YNU5_9BACT